MMYIDGYPCTHRVGFQYRAGLVPWQTMASALFGCWCAVQVSVMEYKGDTHHKSTLTWLVLSDKKFSEKYGYSLAELEEWGKQWVCSERARQYGLDKAKEPGMARAHQARQRRRRAKVAARRQNLLEAGEE